MVAAVMHAYKYFDQSRTYSTNSPETWLAELFTV